MKITQGFAMIHVIATIQLAPGSRAAFLKEFHALVPLVRAEAGCHEYGPAVDVETGMAVQPALRPDCVVVIEKWADMPALKAHLVAPHMATYRTAVKDYVKDLTLHVMESA
jgi:quinol monooxygenase YgiN